MPRLITPRREGMTTLLADEGLQLLVDAPDVAGSLAGRVEGAAALGAEDSRGLEGALFGRVGRLAAV